ncbi:hypothetical protein ES703_117173 [subsurface metagenome]
MHLEPRPVQGPAHLLFGPETWLQALKPHPGSLHPALKAESILRDSDPDDQSSLVVKDSLQAVQKLFQVLVREVVKHIQKKNRIDWFCHRRHINGAALEDLRPTLQHSGRNPHPLCVGLAGHQPQVRIQGHKPGRCYTVPAPYVDHQLAGFYEIGKPREHGIKLNLEPGEQPRMGLQVFEAAKRQFGMVF